jgi:4,5-DOPA dioxygenase extradiol
MFPKADVPVLQIAMPGLEPKPLFELGRALAPLRDEGVLIVAAGLFVHNFNAMDFGSIDHPATADSTVKWSAEFDAWVKDVLVRNDWDALLDYRARAPHVGRALPTHEHFAPKIVVAGAVAGKAVPVEFPITGFVYGTHTRRSVQLG